MNFGDRIKALLKENNFTSKQLSKETGIPYDSLKNYEYNRRKPTGEALVSLEKFFNVSGEYLMGETDVRNIPLNSISTLNRIPLLGTVMAGEPTMAEENILDYIDVSPKLIEKGDHFALYIKGRSMEPVLHEGDIVIVRKCQNVENGKLAIVFINGDEATIKQVWKNTSGITLTAFNPSVYQPTTYTNEDIENKPIRIAGVVVESRRNFSYSEYVLKE